MICHILPYHGIEKIIPTQQLGHWVNPTADAIGAGTQRGQADGFDLSEMEKLQGSISSCIMPFPYIFHGFCYPFETNWASENLFKATLAP